MAATSMTSRLYEAIADCLPHLLLLLLMFSLWQDLLPDPELEPEALGFEPHKLQY